MDTLCARPCQPCLAYPIYSDLRELRSSRPMLSRSVQRDRQRYAKQGQPDQDLSDDVQC